MVSTYNWDLLERSQNVYFPTTKLLVLQATNLRCICRIQSLQSQSNLGNSAEALLHDRLQTGIVLLDVKMNNIPTGPKEFISAMFKADLSSYKPPPYLF